MRVISGSAGGVPLSVPSQGIRPTMDRVRAALFSSLAECVPGARVLDLFGGSGGLGIEALSRGAATAVFVDKDRSAVECIRRNLAKTRLSGSIQQMDAFRFLRLYAHPSSLDLIFADPPYTKSADDPDFATQLLQAPELRNALTDNGTFVLETADAYAIEPAAEASAWKLVRSRAYGGSSIHFLTPAR